MQYLVLTEEDQATNWNDKGQLLKEEAKIVWELQKKEIIRNIWFTLESRNAVLMIEEESEELVKEILNKLPLVRENLIKYRIIALTSYDGYERLFSNE